LREEFSRQELMQGSSLRAAVRMPAVKTLTLLAQASTGYSR